MLKRGFAAGMLYGWSAMAMSSMIVGLMIMSLGTSPLRDSRSFLMLGLIVGYLAWKSLSGERARAETIRKGIL